jgi:Ca2+-binding EF-hand superfamily protein
MVETARELASDAAYELVTSRPEDAAQAREELNQIWAAGNLRPEQLGSDLQDSHILPGLVLHDSENLDLDGDGKLPYRELLDAAYSEDADPLTRNLAEYLAQQAYMRSSDYTLDEFRAMSALPVDPVAGEMDFDPDTFSDGETRTSELAYAYQNFDELDRDADGFITGSEIDETLAGGVSAADAAKLRDLKAREQDLEELSNDENWDENSGITREDLRVAAEKEAVALTGEREESGEADDEGDSRTDAPVTADEVLSGEADESDEPSEYLRDLQDEDSTVEERLEAVKALVAAGTTTATIEDADGNPLKVRMEVQPISEGSDRSYVHLFAVDENGRETVILRAMSSGDEFTQQRDGNGSPVSYVGRKWSETHPESVFAE